MNKTAIVYWSGTGNTELMANCVLSGAKAAGAEAELYPAVNFTPELAKRFDAIAFGCPAMGAEELEESEFLPMFESVKPALSGKKIALFGSYGWGDGEWIRLWADDCASCGCTMVEEPLMVNGTPDDDGEELCRTLGMTLANA